MRRPLFVFCLALLLTQVAAIYLPLGSFVVLAAIFAVLLLVFFAIKRHGYAVCVLLGLVCGGALFFANQTRNLATIEPYLDETVTITARVESPYTSYIEDMMSATLWVDSVNGQAVSFGCYIALLPEAEEGELIQVDVLISSLSDETDKLSNYSEGVFAQAEYVGAFSSIGFVGGLRGFFITAQETLSSIIRAPFSKEVGGVLAAMTVGDRDNLLDSVSEIYRKAGLLHVLVVSGLHLSLACSIVMIRKTTRKARVLKSALTMAIALFLAGLVGATASVMRAVFVLAMYSIGQLIDEKSDPITSLSLAGAVLVFTNGYALCSLSFQLSFLATAGVLVGAEFSANTVSSLEKRGFSHRWFELLYTGLVITLVATFATFPILVLWNMNISLLAFLSNMLTFWMIPLILLLGFAGALFGLIPFLGWLSTIALTAAAILVAVLNKIVTAVSLLPGAQLYFETEYAALVCLVVFVLGVFASLYKIRYRVAIPCMASVLVCGIALGNYYMQGVYKVALVGTSSYPAVVISQQQEAIVLFRGGTYNTQMVEFYLETRNITDILLVVDLRTSPTSECALEAQEMIAISELTPLDQIDFAFGQMQGVLFYDGDGGVAVLDFGAVTVATASGSLSLSEDYTVDVLLATSSDAGSVVGEILLGKNCTNDWLDTYVPAQIYTGDDTVSLWLRYDGDYKLLGVEDGE